MTITTKTINNVKTFQVIESGLVIGSFTSYVLALAHMTASF